MRKLLTAMVAISGFTAVASAEQNGPTAEVRAILDRAIQATGGKVKLAEVKTISGQGTATYYGELIPLRAGVSGAVRFPDKKRMSLEFGVDGFRTTFTEILNGQQGWTISRGGSSPMDADHMAAMQADVYLNWLTTLVPLRERALRLTALGDVDVNGASAQGIRVQREGRPEVRLYFDRDNGLLVKSEVAVNANQAMTYFYSDYKDFQGIQRATHQSVLRNGKNFLDVRFSEVGINPALDADEFSQP